MEPTSDLPYSTLCIASYDEQDEESLMDGNTHNLGRDMDKKNPDSWCFLYHRYLQFDGVTSPLLLAGRS
jgi:hypothetical protein